MVKETPSLGRIAAMVAFTLSCFAILLFLWISFGGTVPLKPEGYRFTAAFPEAATLVEEADVRLAGVNVGKVRPSSPRSSSRAGTPRSRATRARSCVRRPCSARPTSS